ncbi:MAG: NAD(P)/FAD-dependent oxidoreductase, partial [Frankiales bacterium]|nr:NAD(P)/FAD-dependent oxidoreductase [Frankiales bacterium]
VAEEVRRAGHPGPLTLVGDESAWPYDRPPLSKAALQDGAPPPLLRPVEEYGELDLDLRLGVAAVHLDPAARALRLSDGATVTYDALVLAPGAVPRRLPGRELAGVHVLRTADDAAALRADLLEHRALTVVGGGFLGCEVAASARRLGAAVDLVELLPGPLVRVVGPALAARVRALHERHGVRLHTGVGVHALQGHDAVEAFELDDGRVLSARTLLVALGVTPATAWLRGALPLADDGGICCDEAGLAADAVWAVGDAAAWGSTRRVEHWTSAVQQAAAVARSVLGTPTPDTSVPYVWSDQYDSTLQCVGEVAPGTETEVLQVGAGLVALHTDGDSFSGAVLLDAKKLAGRVRRVLSSGGSLNDARVAVQR